MGVLQFVFMGTFLLVFSINLGNVFGYEHYGVKADLLCCGKGIASGFPLSAVIGTSDVMDLPEVGNMSSTHSANPLSCVAGHENLREILDKNSLIS